MVTRYDVESDPQDGPCSLWPVEDTKGPFVRYEDYEALEVKYWNLCQVVEETQRALNMALPDDEDC